MNDMKLFTKICLQLRDWLATFKHFGGDIRIQTGIGKWAKATFYKKKITNIQR